MSEHNLFNLILAGLSIISIEILNDAAIQEWTKIFLQATIAGVTLYKVFKKDKREQE